MIYFFCAVALIIGVGFHIMQAVRRLRKKFPDFGMGAIWSTFLKEEWDSLFVSLLVFLSFEMYLVIRDFNGLKMPVYWEKYGVDYILAFILGYAGQRLAYKYLNTAEKVLAKKADELNERE